jgi:hypothetical protein
VLAGYDMFDNAERRRHNERGDFLVQGESLGL